MIKGVVTPDGTPEISIPVAGRMWIAIIDTGFNGDLELPEALRNAVDAEYDGLTESVLAAGRTVIEESFRVKFPFEGKLLEAQATFIDQAEILIGTHLLQDYRLEIDFPNSTVHLERVRDD